MSVYHTPADFGFTLVGKIVWVDTAAQFHVTAVFTSSLVGGSPYAWGTDRGAYAVGAGPFCGWEPCDLERGSAMDAVQALCQEAASLAKRGQDRAVADATPAVTELCTRLGVTWETQFVPVPSPHALALS